MECLDLFVWGPARSEQLSMVLAEWVQKMVNVGVCL